MAEEKKECVFCNFFRKLFRPKKSGCCSMKIEEVAENEPPQATKPQGRPSCCGGDQTRQGQK